MLDTGFAGAPERVQGEFSVDYPRAVCLADKFLPLAFFLNQQDEHTSSFHTVSLWLPNLVTCTEFDGRTLHIFYSNHFEFLDYTPWREFLYAENEDGCRHGNTLSATSNTF